jgi:hypothetical protein
MKQLALSSPRDPLEYPVTYLPISITDAVSTISAAPGALTFKVRDWVRSTPDRAAADVRPRSAARPPLPAAVPEAALLAHPTPPVSEFVYFLAEEGHVEGLLHQHVCSDSGMCSGCGKAWPCNWRRLTDQALEISSAGRIGRHSVGLPEGLTPAEDAPHSYSSRGIHGATRLIDARKGDLELIISSEEPRERPK